MAWKFNPFTNELDYYETGVVSGNVINVKGIITNANTNPSYPSTPTEGDLWLIGTNSGTVGGTTVQPGDGILYLSATWVLWDMEVGGALYTDEQAQDAVGTILVDSSTIDFTYNDGTPSITAIVINNSITNTQLAQGAANTIKSNPTAALANEQDFAVTTNSLVGRSSGNITNIAFNTFVERFSGTTANRSVAIPSPLIGQLYSNTTTGRLEWYDGTTWRSLPFAQILLTEIQNIQNNRFLGNLSGIAAPPQEITGLDIWDSAQQSYRYDIGGINEWLNATIFTQTASQTVANTVAETTLLGTGQGTLSLPASFFVVGKTLKGRVQGFIGDDAIPPTIRIQVKLNAVTILDTTATTLLSITGTRRFELDFELTNRTTGVSGTIFSQGLFKYFRDNTTEEKICLLNTATNTVDTTISQLLSVTVIWGTANANNTITSTNFNLTKLA
jgi:hypothetical protein